jgi:hypothetical protein
VDVSVLLRICVVVFALSTLSSAVEARSLRDQLPDAARAVGIEGGTAFDALADAIADTAARNLPVVSASAGFTYKYNPQLEVFERTSETLGPIFMERPDTLGQGKLNINVSYQYVNLNQLDGEDTDSLQSPDPIVVRVVDVAGNPLGFTANRLNYDFRLVNHVVGLNATYGLLDNLDVNILLPLIWTDNDVTATNQQQFVAGTDGTFTPSPLAPQSATLDGLRFGVGDIFLRAKYQLPRLDRWRSALGLQLRLPSGDEDDYQGTGTFEASPFLYASTIMWGRVEPHLNLGVDLRADDVARSNGRYALGVDFDITPRLGLAFAFLGRSEFARSSPPGETSFLHLVNPATSQVAQEPLLGINFDRKDYFDLSFGMRVVVWRQIMFFANYIYALNDDGLRNDSVIPMAGFEGTF